jgi:hypothetical protein
MPKIETAYLLAVLGVDVKIRPQPDMSLSEVYMALNLSKITFD